MENKKCINCNSQLSGEFCSSCGQSAAVHRITFKTLIQEYLGRLFGLDTKFLRTAKDLTVNPGIVGRTFIEGNRVKYMGAVAYFFIFTTLYLLSFTIMGVDISEFLYSTSQDLQAGSAEPITAQQNLLQEKYFGFFSQNMRIMNFFTVLFLAMTAKWFYRGEKLNFLEHASNIFYLQGHATLLTIIAVIIFKLTAYNVTIWVTIISVIYLVWAFMKFYRRRGFLQIVKAFTCWVVSMILFMVFIAITTFVGLKLYIKFINPEFLG